MSEVTETLSERATRELACVSASAMILDGSLEGASELSESLNGVAVVTSSVVGRTEVAAP